MTTAYTVGHSTRGADEFRELLKAYAIKRLVDVRQFPASRRFPHFSLSALSASLAEVGIDYTHELDLGGRRPVRPNSPNLYWKNASFRSYADYMASPGFQLAIERLIANAPQRKTAIMCSEAVPWRCHRWLISDALTVRGIDVVHIIGAKHSQPHALNPSALVNPQGHLTYPATGVAGPIPPIR